MKGTTALRGAVSILLACWIGSLVAQPGEGRSFVPRAPEYASDRIFLKPKPDLDPGLLEKLHGQLGNRVIRRYRALGGLQLVRLRKGLSVEEAIISYRKAGLAVYVEPVFRRYLNPTPDDPLYTDGTLWAHHNTGQPTLGTVGWCKKETEPGNGTPDADIDAPEAWDLRTGAADIVVGVIDSGIEPAHVDLSANLWSSGSIGGFDAVAILNCLEDPASDDCEVRYSPIDPVGHGTHVAGTIGAVGDNGIGVAGVAWDVDLMMLKVYDGRDECSDLQDNDCRALYTDAVVEAYLLARENGARVVNASFSGGGYSQAAFDAIEALQLDGVILVAAAGNSGVDTGAYPAYPAAYNLNNIVSVAATDRWDQLPSFSNYNINRVDLAAPGVGIVSTARGDNNDYVCMDGTSMAAPHVAGAVALLLAEFPTLDYRAIIDRLLATTDRLPALSGKVHSEGRLNLHRALAETSAAYFSVTPPEGDAPLTVQFTNQSIGIYDTVSWDFGDGTPVSNASNPQHEYTEPGYYTATLTITGPGGPGTRGSQVVVYSPPNVVVQPEVVPVGDAANVADANDLGSVPRVFRVGRTEITNSEYAAFLNAVDRSGIGGLYRDIMGTSAMGGIVRRDLGGVTRYFVKPYLHNKPVVFVNYFNAVRFINWLYNGQPQGGLANSTTETGVYLPATDTERTLANPPIFLPNENEWYKAAYYKAGGTNAGYWLYPNQSDTRPEAVTAFDVGSPAPGDVANPDNSPASPDGVANFDNHGAWNGRDRGNVISVGSTGSDSTSAYGTYHQGGNVVEWVEGETDDDGRLAVRGAGVGLNTDKMQAVAPAYRKNPNGLSVLVAYSDGLVRASPLGFRIATQNIEEPAITEQPTGLELLEGERGSLVVGVTGYPLSYQWQKQVSDDQWQDLPQATTRFYHFDPVQHADAGDYRVVVSNSEGAAVSDPVAVTVSPLMDFVTVNDSGNQYNVIAEGEGSCSKPGRVDYDYRLGRFEVTNRQYAVFLNAVAAVSDTNGLYNSAGMGETRRGGITRESVVRNPLTGEFLGELRSVYTARPAMGNKPVNYLSFYDAARFVNWLHNGRPSGVQDDTTTEDGAYRITPTLISGNVALERKTGARFFLPTLDEWYKAAYYKGGGVKAGYWQYPTTSNTTPACATVFDFPADQAGVISNPGNTANYSNCANWNMQNGNLTEVGSAGPNSAGAYGTFDQAGNVTEWREIDTTWYRMGGRYNSGETSLAADLGNLEQYPTPKDIAPTTGFRVATAATEAGYNPPPQPSFTLVVDDCHEAGQFTQLAYDSTGNPHIVYYDQTDRDLKYAMRAAGVWAIETVDSAGNVGRFASLQLDSGDSPHVSYYDAGKKRLKYAVRVGGSWSNEFVDARGSGSYSALALNADDVPHISYIAEVRELQSPPGIAAAKVPAATKTPEASHSRVKYITRNASGAWDEPEVVDGTGPLQQPRTKFRYTSIAIDGDGTPHIAYRDSLGTNLKYAYRECDFNCIWRSQTVDDDGNVGEYPAIVTSSRLTLFGRRKTVYISYFDGGNGQLKLANSNLEGWSTQVIDTGGVGRYTSITRDAAGRPAIAYYDAANTDLKFARRPGRYALFPPGWVIDTQHASPGDVGAYSSIAINPSGAAGFAYYDRTNGDVLYLGP